MSGARPHALTTAVAAVLAIVLVGCGTPRRGMPLIGPLQLSPLAHAGERVFMRNCHQCHPVGEGGIGFALNNKPLPAWLIRYQVRNGLGAMPAFSAERISDSELNAVVAYMQALRRAPRRASFAPE